MPSAALSGAGRARPNRSLPLHAPPHVTRTIPGASGLTALRLAWILPAVAAALIYLPALRDGFALDDVVIIANDHPLHQLTTLLAALGRPYWYDEGHLYRPLTTLAFGLEWAAGGGSPLLFHAVNLVWHALVSALVARLALRWWPPLAAASAGLWFAIHPVHAEAVTNIVGRSELVCGAALLALALIATRVPDLPAAHRTPMGTMQESPSPVHPRLLWCVFLLSLCAIASKETGAVAPAIVWLAAVTPLVGDERSIADRRRRASQLAGAAAGGVLVMLAARFLVLGTFAGDEPHYAFQLVPWWRSELFALATVPRALGLVLVPQPPRLDYSPPDADVLRPAISLILLGAMLVSAGALAAWSHLRRPSAWSFIACFAACAYLPASNLLLRTGVVLADRTLYSPSVGAALAAGAAVASAWTARRWLVVAGIGVLAGMGAVFTIGALGSWRDSPTAFAAIRDRSPTSYIGHFMVAKVEDASGDAARAHAEYAIAVALVPHHASLLYMAGANAMRVHDPTEARALLTRALTLEPNAARARTALVGVVLRDGDTASARGLLRDGLALDPSQRTWQDQLRALGVRE